MAERKIFAGGEFLIGDVGHGDVFTPEDFTEEHKMILETAKDFISKEINPVIDRLEEKNHELVLDLLKKAGELGLLGTDVPEEYGGMGLDKVSTTVVGEAMGTAGSFSVVYGAHTGIGTLPIVYFGNEEQKKKYLPKLAGGDWCAAYCLTESGAGSDALNARTKAVLSPDGKYYILNGEKMFITNAGWASSFVVYAKVDGQHFTGFIVEKTFPGVSTGAEEKKMGAHGSSTRPVIFEDAKVPVENLMYEVGKGHKIAFNILNIGRWKLGAMTMGGCKGCVTGAVKYAKGRVQFKVPISSFGMIKQKIADMAIRTYMSESMMYRLAGMFDDKLGTLDEKAKKSGAETAKAIEEYAPECSISKVYGSECLDFCTDEYVQILGGYGYCSEYPAERYYRDARINRIWEGTNEINRMLVPGTMLQRALKGQLALLPAAQAVAGELMTYSPLSVQLPDTPLALQQHVIKMSKKLALMVAGVAAQKFGPGLVKEQEVMGKIADMVIEIFAMESGLLRTLKLIEKEGEEKAKYHIAAVKAYVDDTMPRIESWAKQVISHVESGDMLRTQLAGVKKLARYQPIDAINEKRLVADRIIELESYPF
ncbi:MAG: acyl-CoA dehydrogenase [Deltaproteobacteria bacterium CG_4_8_14_3_um_filter_51_11]|nr:acyl-CoA dehydrogenase [bacterium]OIP41239.1 MAG: acyl-CoA dehydrogenase [Desulfobacteraceae bacterium CG2_30_51_40]PIP45586.1 MAG: acyl-CoA dehydrogenase [Deltaproteobacteria bacterium CG23_combo_of_CG06-09_8_20_14_all_51_20]PIX18611.1 MAG: acyl-CoA dehydrogenase [Deltaproteobacteria bacterium CG_4_8_14_3_um_filter_51_11]PIY24775.1 MAG: acyl-CoA dehydrogenase [Deltaproteobacteria bacterium CG_4_10_14_3_um_filter_51_14]PJB36816.1 MAG: acyl-CoA dehydrogenase [Deltaproteobacteria bacterium CG